jgi:hypothetical protein
MLMGPCPGMAWPELATWYPAFLAGTKGALDVSVYHSYNQIVPTPPRVLYCNTTVPSGNVSTQGRASAGGTGWYGSLSLPLSPPAAAAPHTINSLTHHCRQHSNHTLCHYTDDVTHHCRQGKAIAEWSKEIGVPVWLGEGGPHNGGGGGEYASTFVSSFGYLDTLATLSSLNHSVFARQTLVGGNYELLRCSSGAPGGPEPSSGWC